MDSLNSLENPEASKPAENQAKPEAEPKDRILKSLSRYTRTLTGIRTTHNIMMPIIADISIKSDRAFDKYVAENAIKTEEDVESISYAVPIEKTSRFKKLKSRTDALDIAFFQTPRALLVSLVSAYDAYLGDLLRAMFYLKPELLQVSQRQLTFKELTEFATIEKAREFILEKEVESVIRDSHAKQFDWMESRFSMPLRKGLESWSAFIELTERRNLFVHCDGVVSSQYLDVCKKHGADTKALNAGDALHVEPAYFSEALECLYKIGVKLAHVLWRKLDEENLEYSDAALIDTGFELLSDKEYSLAVRLLEFAVNGLPKHASSLNKRILTVNLCIAYKLGGKRDKCENILKNQDWSDCDERFRLAVEVLNDKFKTAAETMISLGANSKTVPRHAYESWPLFHNFRRSEEFLTAFKALFGQEFLFEEKPSEKGHPQTQGNVAAIINSPQLPADTEGDAHQTPADPPDAQSTT